MDSKLTIIKYLMDIHDDSFYLYDEIVISRQITALKEKFPHFEFLYSIKANPFSPVVDFITSQGFGADAASAQEVSIGISSGLPCEKILYSTPGKTRRDIENTLGKAVIIADSYNELILINDAARAEGYTCESGLEDKRRFLDGWRPRPEQQVRR